MSALALRRGFDLSCMVAGNSAPRKVGTKNKKLKTWDKFVMGELKGMTLGLLGAGSYWLMRTTPVPAPVVDDVSAVPLE